MSTTPSYALHSILLAYALAFLPFYYSNLRLIYATGGKWSLSMSVLSPPSSLSIPPFPFLPHHQIRTEANKRRPRTNLESLKSKVPKKLWNQCYRARCAHENALEGFPFFAAAMVCPLPPKLSFLKQVQLAGTISKLPAEELNKAAVQYLGLRVLYTVLYIGIEREGFSLARSGVWGVSLVVPGVVIWRAGCVSVGVGGMGK
jgi:uncharacterized MAPEG superfamily protein